MIKVIGLCAAITIGMFTYTILLSLWVAQGHTEPSYHLKWELATLLAMMVTFTLAISESIGAAKLVNAQARIINAYSEAVDEAVLDDIQRRLESEGIETEDMAQA